MKRLVKTWWLRTENLEQVYTDKDGNYTLDATKAKLAAEFREGEHPDDDKDIWAQTASDLLNVKCHCVSGPNWTEDGVYG
jgi:hypothetical protein